MEEKIMTGYYKNYRIEMGLSGSFKGRYKITMETPTGRKKTAYTNNPMLYDEFRDSIEDGMIKIKTFKRIRAFINYINKRWS